MNRRGAVRAALLLVVAALTLAAAPPTVTATSNAEPEPPLPEVPVTAVDNEFIGENERFFEDCVGNSFQLPRCGSKGRGGWRQAAVFVAVAAGVGIVVLRIVLGARRSRERSETPPAGTPPAGPG